LFPDAASWRLTQFVLSKFYAIGPKHEFQAFTAALHGDM